MYWLIFIILAIVLGSLFGFGTFLQVLGWAVLLPVLLVVALFTIGAVAYWIAYGAGNTHRSRW